MVEEGSSDGSLRKRSALADVTNLHGKRGFNHFLMNFTGKTPTGFGENTENREENLETAKKVCQGLENSVKTKSKWNSEFVEEVTKNEFQLSKSKQFCSSENVDFAGQSPLANTASGVSRIPNEIKELPSMLREDLRTEPEMVTRPEFLGKVDGSKNIGTTSSISMHVADGQCSKDENLLSNLIGGKCEDDKEMSNPTVAKNVVFLDPLDEELTTNIVGDDDEGMDDDDDDATSNKSSSSSCLEPSQSSSSKFFESERCKGFNGDDGSDSTTATGLDLLKACSCSFCLKAAHIWADLHYQDTKGRIAALKKSRKEARSLVEKSSIPADFVKFCEGNSNKSLKLEVELMDRWRSLFLHTEDILLRESTHLQSSLLTLKDLRENCKADLEIITGDSSNKK